MLLLHMQEIVPVDFRRAFCPLEEGGGGGQTYWHQAYNSVCKDAQSRLANIIYDSQTDLQKQVVMSDRAE